MGFNTVVLIRNDGFGQLEQHPGDFVRGIQRGTASVMRPTLAHKVVDIAVGNHGNVAQVVSCDHADYVHLIAAGGNYATDLGRVYFPPQQGHHSEEGQVNLLKCLADKLGYRLVKKGK